MESIRWVRRTSRETGGAAKLELMRDGSMDAAKEGAHLLTSYNADVVEALSKAESYEFQELQALYTDSAPIIGDIHGARMFLICRSKLAATYLRLSNSWDRQLVS
jgi:hypothetical protein